MKGTTWTRKRQGKSNMSKQHLVAIWVEGQSKKLPLRRSVIKIKTVTCCEIRIYCERKVQVCFSLLFTFQKCKILDCLVLKALPSDRGWGW